MNARKAIRALQTLIEETRGYNDLGDILGDLTPAEWRAIVVAAADNRCIACGEFDACTCSDLVDHAKLLITRRASDLS